MIVSRYADCMLWCLFGAWWLKGLVASSHWVWLNLNPFIPSDTFSTHIFMASISTTDLVCCLRRSESLVEVAREFTRSTAEQRRLTRRLAISDENFVIKKLFVFILMFEVFDAFQCLLFFRWKNGAVFERERHFWNLKFHATCSWEEQN